jgi:hypothetical protein
MVKKSDGKYNSSYAQASAIWNKERGGKIMRPKKDTPEYDAIKKIESKIKAGEIASLVRTQQEREANKVRRKALKEPKNVIVEMNTNTQSTFKKKQVLEPEANPRPVYQPKPVEVTPDETALSGGVEPSTPMQWSDQRFYSELAESRLLNRKLYKKMLATV